MLHQLAGLARFVSGQGRIVIKRLVLSPAVCPNEADFPYLSGLRHVNHL